MSGIFLWLTVAVIFVIAEKWLYTWHISLFYARRRRMLVHLAACHKVYADIIVSKAKYIKEKFGGYCNPSFIVLLSVVKINQHFLWYVCPLERCNTDFHTYPYGKVHGANMGPTWVLSAPDGPHVGPMNLVIRVVLLGFMAQNKTHKHNNKSFLGV